MVFGRRLQRQAPPLPPPLPPPPPLRRMLKSCRGKAWTMDALQGLGFKVQRMSEAESPFFPSCRNSEVHGTIFGLEDPKQKQQATGRHKAFVGGGSFRV